ncbi:MAG: septal ring lytic transglycosylase RlpA family protein [Alphaproteobacteria bacterium]|jgi:rare lipoprotein A|nr:septal ring lytic transglycosylase RlpA family protein [Alphaproteobacteria bacterium]
MTRPFKKVLTFLSVAGAALLVGCAGGPEVCDEAGTTPCHPTFAKRAYNRPYQINGTWYYPQAHYEYAKEGIASYYGGTDVFHGRPTSNGEIFDKNKLTAAHKTVPIPCVVRVTNLKNGRSIKLRVNDRGPFVEGRIIDVSQKAAQMLGFHKEGLGQVRVETCIEDTLVLAEEKAGKSGKKGVTQLAKAAPLKKKKPQTTFVAHKKPAHTPKLVEEDDGYFIEATEGLVLAKAHEKADTFMALFPKAGVSLVPLKGQEKGQYHVLLGPMKDSEEAHSLLNLLKRVKVQDQS